MWDVRQYERYRDERSRPFVELLARLPGTGYRRVVDLGCGTGELTLLLADRFPEAAVTGIDTSEEMLAAARPRASARVSFERGDAATWARPVDLAFSNATLQWVADHPRLLAHIASYAGALAVQVPANFDAPSHVLLNETATEGPWAPALRAGWRPNSVLAPTEYVALLWKLGFEVDAWETTYLHVLPGEDAVLEWTRGTALRPVLALLAEPDRSAFLASYGAKLRKAYPRTDRGTIFPFKRLFFAAVRR
jgi:trans-aconitate 2-methyltransferase